MRREKIDKKGRELGEKVKKGSVCYFFTAYDPFKNMKPLTFFNLNLTPVRLKTNSYMRENENYSSA